MKRTLLIILSILFCAITFAQSVPQGINYQAVARDANGDVLMNQALTIQFSVISDVTTSAISWQETHQDTTNAYGLFTAIIGGGTSTSVGSSLNFDVIDWGASNHLLKVEVDYGNGLVDMGTTAFMSVPYALSSGSTINSLWQDNGIHLSPDSTTSQDIIISGQTDIYGGIAIDGDADIWGTTRMSVVGIGTTNPTETLDVDGNVRMRTGSSLGYIAVSDSNGVMNWTDPMTINALQGIQGVPGVDGDDGNDGIDGVDGVDGQGGITNAGTGISVTGAGTSVSPYVVSTSTCGLSIGDTTQGGIIFYLDPSGCHGLVCALTDHSSTATWYSSFSYMHTRAYGSGLFEGKYNTKMINWEQGGSTAAAAICAAYTGGSFNDWYLPSIEELNKMYLNIGQGNALGLGDIGGFAIGNYWSSTEIGSNNAWGQNLTFGYQGNSNKDDLNHVRAVRAF
jgi:hypothetical protein